MDCSPPGSSVHGDSPGKNTGVGCHDLPDPGIKPKCPAAPVLKADSLPLPSVNQRLWWQEGAEGEGAGNGVVDSSLKGPLASKAAAC